MASQGWIFLNDATNLTSLLGGLGGIIAASQILKQSLGTSSRLQTATELLKQCNTYTSHIKKMINENGEELWSHRAFVNSMEGELERMERDILRIKGQLDTSNQWREELNYWGKISSEIGKVTRSLKDHQTVLAKRYGDLASSSQTSDPPTSDRPYPPMLTSTASDSRVYPNRNAISYPMQRSYSESASAHMSSSSNTFNNAMPTVPASSRLRTQFDDERDDMMTPRPGHYNKRPPMMPPPVPMVPGSQNTYSSASAAASRSSALEQAPFNPSHDTSHYSDHNRLPLYESASAASSRTSFHTPTGPGSHQDSRQFYSSASAASSATSINQQGANRRNPSSSSSSRHHGGGEPYGGGHGNMGGSAGSTSGSYNHRRPPFYETPSAASSHTSVHSHRSQQDQNPFYGTPSAAASNTSIHSHRSQQDQNPFYNSPSAASSAASINQGRSAGHSSSRHHGQSGHGQGGHSNYGPPPGQGRSDGHSSSRHHGQSGNGQGGYPNYGPSPGSQGRSDGHSSSGHPGHSGHGRGGYPNYGPPPGQGGYSSSGHPGQSGHGRGGYPNYGPPPGSRPASYYGPGNSGSHWPTGPPSGDPRRYSYDPQSLNMENLQIQDDDDDSDEDSDSSLDKVVYPPYQSRSGGGMRPPKSR